MTRLYLYTILVLKYPELVCARLALPPMYLENRVIRIVTLILCAAQFMLDAAEASEWRLSKEYQGVQIFSRYPQDGPYKEFRGEIEVNAKPDRVVRLFQDLNKISEWHYRTKTAEVLDLVNMTNAYVYIVNAPPWPVKPRDVICKVSLQLDRENDLIRITIDSVDGFLPVTEEYVRTAKLKAEWQIKPVTETTSLLRYQVFIDPAGKIPRWLFNSFAVDVPLITLLNLKRKFAAQKE